MTAEPDGRSHAGLGVRLVDRALVIDAPPERVYTLLTTADGLVRWMAPEADVHPAGARVVTRQHPHRDRVSGRFVELVPNRRVVFTYGWDRDDVGIPTGSTTVEITLTALPGPTGSRTELRLVHRGLSGPMATAHDGGWGNYLARLAAVAERRDPGPDPLAHQRVPSAGNAAPRDDL